MTASPNDSAAARGPLFRDSSFWGMTITQLLGAFNDNVFKQLVLLIGIDYVAHYKLQSDPYQSVALAAFAIPFVLLSGFAGWLADRVSKRNVVVLMKVAEIVVMLAGMTAFLSGEMYSTTLIGLLILVLCLMSAQSAVFGPSKYGILPELFHEHDLPQANGMIQMTTFLAIIFGMAVCGAAKDFAHQAGIGLWIICAGCVVIAVIGTLTSLTIRKTAIAVPDLPIRPSSFGIDRNTLAMLRDNRRMLTVLLISCLFWFLGSMVTTTVNAFGRLQLGLGDLYTSLLAAVLAVGIAVGCVLAGAFSKGRVRFGLVNRASWGICGALLLLAGVPMLELDAAAAGWLSGALLVALGIAAGLFAVPLQVYLQAKPPADQKGRMIGAMNLINWIAILISAPIYAACSWLFTLPPESVDGPPRSIIAWTFAILAAMILPVSIWFQPQDETLE